MSPDLVTDKMALTELCNKLFMYTDSQQWHKLLDEVFTEHVWFDMTSAGEAAPKLLPSTVICNMWKDGFAELDAVHHQAGHYLVEVDNDSAQIFAYAVALHMKRSARLGISRRFVGSYDLKAARTVDGWRLNQFKYNLKFIDGNATLE